MLLVNMFVGYANNHVDNVKYDFVVATDGTGNYTTVQAAINARNTHFQKPLTGELEIREILEEEAAPTTDNRYKNETVFMSASQFKEMHGDKIGKLSLVQIRAVFERLGIPKEEKSKVTYDKKTSLRNTYEVPYRHLI